MNVDNASDYDVGANNGQNYYPANMDPSMAESAAVTDSYYGADVQSPPPYMSQTASGGGAYVDGSAYRHPFHAAEELEYHHDPSMGPGYGEWYPDQQHHVTPEVTVPPGSYYPTTHLSPELHNAPVSAVAYNDVSAAMHVASHTQSMGHPGERRWVGHQNSRASLLVTHSTTDGMLYSSCAGHPEADSNVLKSLMKQIYNFSPSRPEQHRIPPHAYRPPYCGGDSGPEALNPYVASSTSSSSQMGIRKLLPFDGYIASVSPAAVRLHNQGGLLVSDQDIQGMMCGTPHPGGNSTMTHMTVGGTAWGFYKTQQVHCMDLYQGLRIVSSHGFKTDNSDGLVVTALATNHQKQAIVAGCSDGTIRLIDASWRKRGGIDLAKVASHLGGVTSVTVSDDGNLICTAGYSSRPSATTGTPYAFPDRYVMIYDTRYLGRGGVVHPFSGIQGDPRFVSFLPNNDTDSNRVLICSGQSGGGMQVMTPFETSDNGPESYFNLVPHLALGEFVTDMCVSGRDLALGTSQSKVVQYRMAGNEATTHSFGDTGSEFVPSTRDGEASGGAIRASHEREPLVMPSYAPRVPSLSIDPTILLTESGPNKSVFSSYLLHADPYVTPLGDKDHPSSFGPLTEKAMLTAPKRTISARVVAGSNKTTDDYFATVPTSELDLDLFETKEKKPLLNPNKLLYSKISSICYDVDVDPGKKSKWGERKRGGWNDGASVLERTMDEDGHVVIPPRYCCTLRPTHIGASYFDHSQHNDTGIYPGWEYPHTMPNAFATSVLLLLYFVPELRSAIVAAQYDGRIYSLRSSKKAPTLSPELGFLYHQIESISRHAMTHPEDSCAPRVGAFVPYNFLAAFAAMPEASALALLDGAPAAVETARRPEAFFRFLLHHLDGDLTGNDTTGPKLIDSLYGLGFTSVNEFITGSGPPSVSSTRVLTVELAYDPFTNATRDDSSSTPSFGEILRYSLCKEARLRAWCDATRSYETVVQRKVATSLPRILALSCSCSGKRGAEDGLSVWRNASSSFGYFLPEIMEVELEDDGNIVVRELKEEDGSGKKSWTSFKGDGSLPQVVSEVLRKDPSVKRMIRYKLDAVLSFIRDDLDADDVEKNSEGYHVLHIRVPPKYKQKALRSQLHEVDRLASSMSSPSTHDEDRLAGSKMTLTANLKGELLEQRSAVLRERLESAWADKEDWVIFNGFVVKETMVEDARAFHVPFKEPCLVTYRAVDPEMMKEQDGVIETGDHEVESYEAVNEEIPIQVMNTTSISTGRPPEYSIRSSKDLPGEGDLVAFDAEFVSVQEEESMMTATGSKITVREARSTLARMSLIDCRNGKVIVDDYVLPHEPVVDYLTRFSGIVASDLDSKNSPHHLVTMRSAYLKLRLILQRGCIFVGHGLSQDFLVVNLFVPKSQVIDTVEIFHKEKMRYISLRFLANFLLGRDMQQDTHDSIEDASMAYKIYLKAVSFKEDGSFEKVLNDIYDFGQKTEWKLGVADTA